jgi:hypothetical protein
MCELTAGLGDGRRPKARYTGWFDQGMENAFTFLRITTYPNDPHEYVVSQRFKAKGFRFRFYRRQMGIDGATRARGRTPMQALGTVYGCTNSTAGRNDGADPQLKVCNTYKNKKQRYLVVDQQGV